MRLLVTRPKEDAASLVALLKEKGHEPVLFPLLEIVAQPDGAKQLKEYKVSDIQALLVTSANGVRAFAQVDKRRSFYVLAVGAASAEAARLVGFKHVENAEGDVLSLEKLVRAKCKPEKGKLLHIAGSSVAGDLKGLLEKDGFDFDRVVLYRADKVTKFSDALKADIKAGKIDGALLYSPRTADTFAQLIEQADLKNDIKNMFAYGLSAAVASKIEHLAFKDIKIAATPDQEALLTIIGEPEDEKMTEKKDDKKNADPKVIDARAEDVKIKDTLKTPQPSKSDTAKADAKNKTHEAPKSDDPVEKALNAKKNEPVKKKIPFKTKAIAAGVLIVAAGGAGAYFTQNIWVPKVKTQIAQTLNIETVSTQPHVSVEDVQALADRIAVLENKPAGPTETVDVQPLLDRITELENSLDNLKESVSTIQIGNGSEEKLAEFKELAARLEAVEGNEVQDLSPLQEESQRLNQLVQELNTRLTDVEAARLEARSSGENAQALIAGLSVLRQRLQTSAPYAVELQALTVLAQGDVVLEEAVQKLQDHAETGLVSYSALQTSFEKAANDIVRASAVPESAGWVEQTVKNITSLVTIRNAPGNLDGEGPLGIVARAEHNIRSGDFAGALDELRSLQGKPLEAATPWIDAASARVKGDETLSLIQAHILSLLTHTGGQG
jgi:uroporphyrinogen-III synthase